MTDAPGTLVLVNDHVAMYGEDAMKTRKIDKASMTPSEIGRAMNKLIKNRRGGGAKPRTVLHDRKASYCWCVDCRKARGHYPAHLINKKKPAGKKTR